jgi:glycosyltransferase EpsE
MGYIKKQYRVSVIMGIYNCASTLREAIDSLIAQNYKDWELIMCDDNSKDDTLIVAKEYAEKYENILLIQNTENQGLPFTLNHCLEYANGEYIARMDGDDISLPTRFEKEVEFLDSHPEYALVSCAMTCFDENGDWGVQSKPQNPTKLTFAYMSPFNHAACIMRKKELNEVGNYSVREELRRGQDYYLWYKFYSVGKRGFNLQDRLYKMRDDYNAAKRGHDIKSIVDGMKMQYLVFRGLNIPFYYYYILLRPLLIFLLPTSIYTKLHKIKNSK